MAGVTSAVIGVGLSAYQIAQAEKAKKAARKGLNEYERQTLDNAFENVSISTLGSDLLKEEGQRSAAGYVDTLQNAGVRGVVGGIPKVVASLNNVNQDAAKMLDSQFINREYAIAGDNARIEGIRENRDMSNIAGLSSQLNAAKQDAMNGYMGMASSIAMGAREFENGMNNRTRTPIETLNVNSMPAIGINDVYGGPITASPYFLPQPTSFQPSPQDLASNIKYPFYY